MKKPYLLISLLLFSGCLESNLEERVDKLEQAVTALEAKAENAIYKNSAVWVSPIYEAQDCNADDCGDDCMLVHTSHIWISDTNFVLAPEAVLTQIRGPNESFYNVNPNDPNYPYVVVDWNEP